MKTTTYQKLPSKWNEREKLRDVGQFWTPDWIAEAMVAYVVRETELVFDPGVGKGAFYKAIKKLNSKVKFYGVDIDSEIIDQGKLEGVFDDSSAIEVRDFILNPPQRLFKAIVANPPYIRHHRLSQEAKNKFRLLSLQTIGTTLDGRAGLHVYFLLRALDLLDIGGRLAFIMPADTCEGVFAQKLWSWIARKFCIEGVITFDHKATPFPGVDTNTIIFLIRKAEPKTKIKWVKCLEPYNVELTKFLGNGLKDDRFLSLRIHERNLDEAIDTGLSRSPREDHRSDELILGDFVRVMRGVATGANEFFFLTKERAQKLGIPDEFLLPAVGRTRDVEGNCITQDTVIKLEKKERPTLLFFPNGSTWKDMPQSVRDYILEGEKMGLAKRALISTRQPWYKMEVREIPTFLFAYLGRRNVRFIKNDAGVIPLTGFLCVYPLSNDKGYIEKLWAILQHPDTISNLQLVGKSYGSGAIKVEPRSLERLPINSELVSKVGITPVRQKMAFLFE